MKGNAVRSQLVAKKDGIYTTYVFKLIDSEGYIMCTKLPNWDCPDIPINSIGFLMYEETIAGDKYYDPATESYSTYKYTNVYFKDFLEDNKTQEEKIEILIC